MANNTENVNINLNVNGGESIKSLRQMRNELKSLQDQMDAAAAAGDKPLLQGLQAQFGELKNDIKDLNQEMKFSDTGEFLAGFVKMSKGAVAGFGAVTGAMELFGASTEDVQQIQKKSMVIIQTLQSLEEVRSLLEAKGMVKGLANSAMRVLGLTSQVVATEAVAGANVTATATQMSWNAAMLANPIGLIIAGVVALTAGIVALTYAMSEENGVIEKVNISFDDFRERYKKTARAIALAEKELLVMKGLMTEEELDKYKALEENKLRLTEIYSAKRAKVEEINKAFTAKMNKILEADEDNMNELLLDLAKQKGAALAQIDQNTKAAIKQNTQQYLVDVNKITTEYDKKETDAANKKTDKKIEEEKKYYDRRKEFVVKAEEDDLKSNLEYTYQRLQAAIDESNKRKGLEEDRIDYINQLRLDNADNIFEEYDAKSVILDEQYADDLEKYKNDEEAKKEITKAYEEEKLQIKLEAAQKAADAVTKYSQLASDFVGSLMQLDMENIKEAGDNEVGGKERVEREKKAIQKKYAALNLAIQIAQITADVARGVTSALSLPFPLSLIVGGIYGGIGIAQTAVAAKQYDKIMKAERGMLVGPSHAGGGIPIEAEGGEAIINKRSMAIPALRNLASSINEMGGGVSFRATGSSSQIVSTIDPSIISSIVNQVTSNIVNIPVTVSEYDITKMRRKVQAIEDRGKF